MNKPELASKTGIPEQHAEYVVNVVFDTMAAAMCRGERIEIRGFGVPVVLEQKTALSVTGAFSPGVF